MYKKQKGTTLVKYGTDYYIINSLKESEAFKVNESSARIFDLCDGKRNDTEIIEIVLTHYRGGEITEADIEEFLVRLVELGLVAS